MTPPPERPDPRPDYTDHPDRPDARGYQYGEPRTDGRPVETAARGVDAGIMGRVPATPLIRGPFAVYAIVSAIHVFALAFFPGTAFAFWSKALLMPLLAVGVWAAMSLGRRDPASGARVSTPWRTPAWLLLGGIAFSWVGDTIGHFFPSLPLLPAMIGAFAVAHVLYVVLFLRFLAVRGWKWWALAYVVWYAVAVPVIGPSAGALFIPVAAYALILGGTAAAATRCRPMIVWGGLFFLVSDTVLALAQFMPHLLPTVATDVGCMGTYTLGQGLIAAGVVAALRETDGRGPRVQAR